MPKNGNNSDDSDDKLGKRISKCELGDACPFEGALQRLEEEQHERIGAESALALQIERVAKNAQIANLEIEKFGRALRDLTHDLEKHIRSHRYLDLAVITIAATIGGFLANITKLLMH